MWLADVENITKGNLVTKLHSHQDANLPQISGADNFIGNRQVQSLSGMKPSARRKEIGGHSCRSIYLS